MEYRHKVAVITGGAQGIGKCIFEEFKKLGYVVVIIDKLHQPKDVAPDFYYSGNLADKEVLDDFADRVIEKFGHVDVLVNNAMPLFKGIDECTYEEFCYAQQVGVVAPFYLAKRFKAASKRGQISLLDLPSGSRLGEAKDFMPEGSSIINISSSRDRMSMPQTESYTAAKGGIAALTHALAVSLGPKIRVNSVSPGWIDTDYTEYEGDDATQQPCGRVGNPQDIAQMVLFLCSDKAGLDKMLPLGNLKASFHCARLLAFFITGENICIDGGMTKQMIYHGEHGWSFDK